jgi:NAD(P)H-dependent FMN reductase
MKPCKVHKRWLNSCGRSRPSKLIACRLNQLAKISSPSRREVVVTESEMKRDLQVMLLSGSVREPSHTRSLVESVASRLAERGAATVHWDLGRTPLPIADPEFHSDPLLHTQPRVRKLVELAIASHCFVLGSPIYHNSYSGVLKNALDHLTIRCFQLKPVGLVSHGGNRSTQAVDHLRIVTRGLLGVAIPTQVCTADQDYDQTAAQDYAISCAAVGDRIDRFTHELLSFAQALVQGGLK